MYMTKKCGQQNKLRINKLKQDDEESINISDNVNLKHFYCYPPASEASRGVY